MKVLWTSAALLGTAASCSRTGPTFTADVQPLLAANCQSCHQPGGLAPQSLVSYQDAFTQRQAIAADVQSGSMPPWPPDDTCNSYKGIRALSSQEIDTIVAWTNHPSEGDPSILPQQPAKPVGLSRVDLSLPMTAPYTPLNSPDDYHCFVLDWPEVATQYVTGFTITPGNARIVHDAIAYIATPAQLSSYEAQERALPDGGRAPDYACFGGPISGLNALVGWLGIWTPNIAFSDLPQGTGVQVMPGSKIILQIHYSSANDPGGSDLSSLQLRLDSSVAKQAVLVPFANPAWVEGTGMDIPAGQASVTHAYQVDPGPYLAALSNGALSAGQSYVIYAAAAHMLLRGKSEQLQIVQADGGSSCLLDVPSWNLNWQGNYFFQSPVTLNPGDQLSIACQWDNSPANQPFVDGGQVVPVDLNWGEGFSNEMCLGMFYVTQ